MAPGLRIPFTPYLQTQKNRLPLRKPVSSPPGAGKGDLEAFALETLALHLARTTHSFGSLAGATLGRLLIMTAELHLTEKPFPLHLLLECFESLIDIVVANENLHWLVFSRKNLLTFVMPIHEFDEGKRDSIRIHASKLRAAYHRRTAKDKSNSQARSSCEKESYCIERMKEIRS